jgi:hypothetical protein
MLGDIDDKLIGDADGEGAVKNSSTVIKYI